MKLRGHQHQDVLINDEAIMSTNLKWLTPNHTILLLTVAEYWSWAEMREWLNAIEAVLDQHHEPTGVILDFQYSTYIPQNSLLNTQPILANLHPLAKPVIFARLSIAHRAVLDMITRLYPTDSQRFIIVDRIEDMINLA